MTPDIEMVARLISDIAAEEITPRFRNLAPEEVREKRPNDLVTVADEASERRLTRAFVDLLPGSVVVGEEAVAADPSRLDLLHGADPIWIVDPLDGTSNFAAGRPIISVIVALVRDGETVAGWIHDPLGARMVTAERGSGARAEGERLAVAQWQAGRKLSGSINAGSLRNRLTARRDRLAAAIDAAPGLMCAGQEYMRLARGDIDFSIFSRLHPWDHAAGVLIHAEAGGVSARFDGSLYRPTHREGGILLAPDRASWGALEALLLTDD